MPCTLVRPCRIVLPALALLLVGAAGLLAQNTVNLQGRVTGADGAPPTAAQITVTNRETGQQRSAATSATGTYTIVRPPPGADHVSLRLPDYRPQARNTLLLVAHPPTL